MNHRLIPVSRDNSQHQQVHDKQYTCDHPECSRMATPVRFGTRRDLERHQHIMMHSPGRGGQSSSTVQPVPVALTPGEDSYAVNGPAAIADKHPPIFDAYTPHGHSVDSGYASALASCHQKSGDGSQIEILESIEGAEIETETAETVYSDEGSVTGTELEGYKSDLVDNLVEHSRGLGADPEQLALIFQQLPSWIKALALKLGQLGSTKTERDVMYFLHRYRQ